MHAVRVEELGDTLVVTLRARRARLLFLGFWLTAWTFGGLTAARIFVAGSWGTRAFFLVWIGGWALGEAFVALVVAWRLAGRECISVTPDELEIRRRLGPFAGPAWRSPVHAVQSVAPELVPTGEDEKTRTDFRLRIATPEVTHLVGEGLQEHEAESVAALVRGRTQRSWEPRAARGQPAVGAAPDLVRAVLRLAPVLFVVVLCAGLAADLLQGREHRRRSAPPVEGNVVPPAWPVSLPLPDRSQSPRAYAVAMTRAALGRAQTSLISGPTCGKTVTWTRWVCSARATSRTEPFAGRSYVYSCWVTGMPQRAMCGAMRSVSGGGSRRDTRSSR